ncbi:hypothetical protein ONS95_009723 [Cadophora gregata]|uniref:uncharacterized protein n=1 Tax=Cadophora gregata TaxID=51156 RepID=UPI0026DC2B21|nr:uncharacterized protein ONS95_009723 [Cadophora gregata]KAK0121429.1 hypothetical protein ONS95_009723 [Cadophora gregata]KAK0126900.1 hypothetical protein ONS96_006465 [Cadophora gregata f. sp. sojae]
MDHPVVPSTQQMHGVHEWTDQDGNRGTEILCRHDIRVRTVQSTGLFDIGNKRTDLISYLNAGCSTIQRILVILDIHLPESKRIQIEAYLSWCKTEMLLEDYVIIAFSVNRTEKTLQKSEAVIAAAKEFGLRRRDMFVAIGSITMTDVVGFAAAIYRRSTPWILVPTDLLGIMHCHNWDSKLSLNHVNQDGRIYRNALALVHPPTASFYEPISPEAMDKDQITRFLADIVKTSIGKDSELFSYTEAHLSKMLAGSQKAGYLTTALSLATRARVEERKELCGSEIHVSSVKFGDEAVQAIRENRAIVYDDKESVSTGIALMSVISTLKGRLSITDLGRVLNLLFQAGLPIYNEELEANALWKHMKSANEERGISTFIILSGLGETEFVDATEISSEVIGVALSILRNHRPEPPGKFLDWCASVKVQDPTNLRQIVHEQTTSNDVQYHVVMVQKIFNSCNQTLIRGYCMDNTTTRKRKILVILDSYVGNPIVNIQEYFQSHSSVIENFRILPFHVPSTSKDFNAVLRVVDVAIEMGMSQTDLFVVIGGGTLMDVVGFAAAIYEGGLPYLRIPTTLLGMIDAGVGAKVGVNFGNHKSLLGRYFPPVACLNDPETFLPTLPRREFACGLAESIKIATVKDSRLFEIIERYHGDVEYNAHTHELIQLSIRSMLEELQPNLYEQDLCRFADFGHEFGHIVESLAKQTISHGECVAIGMAISSSLAYRKRILSRSDLERILNCMLDLGLPIYLTDYDCCSADLLWGKISTDGIEHKGGMLYLTVPETIGRGTFLNEISDIDSGMLSEVILSLCRYSEERAGSSRTISKPERLLVSDTGNHSPLTTAAVIGGSGDIGSQLVGHLVRNGVRVVCSVRSTTSVSFRKRQNLLDPKVRILTGNLLNFANLRWMIREADVLYNMAGIVSLNSKLDEFAKVIAINGLAQGVITHIIREMGRDKDLKVVYPSSQRVHLTDANVSVDTWIQEAGEAFSKHADALIAEQDTCTALEKFAELFISNHPLPAGFNIYEISKRLGEFFVSLLPRHSLMRISSVYGPAFTRGFTYRAINPKSEGNFEMPEKRDFIYSDDLNELLLRVAQTQSPDSRIFDAASGESIDLEEVWRMIRGLIGDSATLTLQSGVTQEEFNLDSRFARRLLGRELTPLSVGLKKTVEESARASHPVEQIMRLSHPVTFKSMEIDGFLPGATTTLKFICSGDLFRIAYGVSPTTEILERSLSQWFDKLLTSHQEVLSENTTIEPGLCIRLRSDGAMKHGGEFVVEEDGKHDYRSFIEIRTELVMKALHQNSTEIIDDIIGCMGYHFLAFLLRGRKPILSLQEQKREQEMAFKWKDSLKRWDRHHIIVLDVGATYLRVAIKGPHGLLLHDPNRVLSPSKQAYPQYTLPMLQGELIKTIVREVNIVRAGHIDLSIEEVGISFGAVVTREGIVEDASILWGSSARGYDFKATLLEYLPGMRLTVLNDVSAAAWRYKDEGRFCLITVSSGLSNKVFNPDLCLLDKLDLDASGIGGEMGHVIVEPRAVDALVQYAMLQAAARPEEFRGSLVDVYVHGHIQRINSRCLALAAKEDDEFAVRILEERDIPYCACGNLADLCAYSSGRGALRRARSLASSGGYDIASNAITDDWLRQSIASGHPLALKVLSDSTYPLALRILQLAGDIGLNKFIIVGGFAMKTGKEAYLLSLQDHLVRFFHPSGFFCGWKEDDVRSLVQFGVNDDNDGLIGMGNFVEHLRSNYRAVEKVVGRPNLTLVTRKIPLCGSKEVLAKVVFAGICTTDLQILRGERGVEPIVLGHEAVCQVLEVGKGVKGLSVNEMIVMNPNNPLDDHDKLGHTREGVFQEYFKFGQESLERRQVLTLGSSAASVVDTLVEPLSCVVAAQNRIKDRIAGKNVLVIGAGMMGLLFVLMNHKMGAKTVFLANRSKERLDFAVTKAIIRREKVFVTSDCVAAQVSEVSAGQGADVVIVCVSLGQGVNAAQDAIRYVNAGGCVYLFAGFSPGDTLTLDEGIKLDVWPIRTHWKTESIKVAGKAVDLSGHRGSRNEDLVSAINFIRKDRLSFGSVISHIISLDVLPEVLQRLAQDGTIQGISAKRVIVDMDARNGTIESIEKLPLLHLQQAAGKRKDAIPMGNMFRDLGFDGNISLLGWFHPPAWHEIKTALEAALKRRSLTSKKHFIWVGTGGWVFLVDVLKEIIPASQDIHFHTLRSLDPQALVDVFSLIEELSSAVCLGMSQSGTTLETVMLMDSLRERFDTAGLNYQEHFIWLTDTCISVNDLKSGEARIRSSQLHDWKCVDVEPLTVRYHADINALFCAPHSMLMFLPLFILLCQDWEAMSFIYQQYLALRDEVVNAVLPIAWSVALNDTQDIQVNLDEDIAPTMGLLVAQLIEQALGSKQVGFNPRVCVTSCGELAEFEHIAMPIPTTTPKVVKVMLTMNALSAFVAILAYHREIQFVTHPKVQLYKRRALDLVAAAEVKRQISETTLVSAEIVACLDSNPRVRFVEIICYGHALGSSRQSVKDWSASCLGVGTRSIHINVHQGEDWNHSKYQAAVQTDDTLYVILVLQNYFCDVEGISSKAIYDNTAMLQAIARATYETLAPRALYFSVEGKFPN